MTKRFLLSFCVSLFTLAHAGDAIIARIHPPQTNVIMVDLKDHSRYLEALQALDNWQGRLMVSEDADFVWTVQSERDAVSLARVIRQTFQQHHIDYQIGTAQGPITAPNSEAILMSRAKLELTRCSSMLERR